MRWFTDAPALLRQTRETGIVSTPNMGPTNDPQGFSWWVGWDVHQNLHDTQMAASGSAKQRRHTMDGFAIHLSSYGDNNHVRHIIARFHHFLP
jgi:hypothetical protein